MDDRVDVAHGARLEGEAEPLTLIRLAAREDPRRDAQGMCTPSRRRSFDRIGRGNQRGVCDDGTVVIEDPLELISIDPEVCHGQPCIKGTRVMVTVVLDALAAGLDVDEIVSHYPTLTPDGVRAAVAYGAWLAKQEIRPLTPST
jgi:uncharacterized protein (DUF433 family)